MAPGSAELNAMRKDPLVAVARPLADNAIMQQLPAK